MCVPKGRCSLPVSSSRDCVAVVAHVQLTFNQGSYLPHNCII